eukprot:Rhum_TRINITY_DN14409_c16_g1::Rhum_TRINITY_DN14409_c16_g1_i1::g.88441::m.88441
MFVFGSVVFRKSTDARLFSEVDDGASHAYDQPFCRSLCASITFGGRLCRPRHSTFRPSLKSTAMYVLIRRIGDVSSCDDDASLASSLLLSPSSTNAASESIGAASSFASTPGSAPPPAFFSFAFFVFFSAGGAVTATATVVVAAAGDDDENATRVSDYSEGFDSVFQLLQAVSQVMVQCPLHSVRAGGVALLKAVLGTLRERTRFKMYLALVRACPYQSVVSLVVVLLKEEVCAEYGAFQAAVDGGADASALRRLKEGSAFLQADVALFFARYVEEGAGRLGDRGEGVAAALSLLLFVLLRETRLAEQQAAGAAPPGVGLQRTHLERLRGAVGALERALGGEGEEVDGGVAAACAPPGAAAAAA